jgi:outer membrane immunogenic protein
MQRILFSAAVPAAFVAVILSAGPAFAQARVEIHGGLDNLRTGGDGESGALYGIGLGYDFQLGTKTFAGIEVNAEDSKVSECEAGGIVLNDRICGRTERDLSAALRFGTRVGAAGKAYGLVGYSNARFFTAYTAPAGPNVYTTDDLDGIRAGVGYQQQIAGSFYVKAEYRYTNYEQDAVRHQGIVGFGLSF